MNTTIHDSDLVVRIATLRHALLTASYEEDGSFGKVQDLFMELIEVPGFFEESRCAELPRLQQIVAATIAKVSKKSGSMSLILTRLGDTDFHHGSFLWGGRSGTVLWFEKDERGLICVPLANGQAATVRIGLRPLSSPPDPAGRREDLN